MHDFLSVWKKGTASQQKRLLARLFMRLRVTAKGLGVRYQWTSEDEAGFQVPENKKAPEFCSEASVSNLHVLDQYRRPHLAPESREHSVFCASAAKIGRGDRIRTCDPLLPKQMRYQTAPLPEVR